MPQRKGAVPWNKGTKGVCKPNSGSFRPGNVAWSAGLSGLGVLKPNSGSFGQPGRPGGKPLKPPGTRRWSARDGEVFVKVDTPSPYLGRYSKGRKNPEAGWWRPLRIVNFEAVHGPVPPGGVVRRLLPLCDCEPNLILIDKNVNARLNKGDWCVPIRPWRTLPLDRDVRLAAAAAAVAAALARERSRRTRWPCHCGCGRIIDRFDKQGRERRYWKGHNGYWTSEQRRARREA